MKKTVIVLIIILLSIACVSLEYRFCRKKPTFIASRPTLDQQPQTTDDVFHGFGIQIESPGHGIVITGNTISNNGEYGHINLRNSK